MSRRTPEQCCAAWQASCCLFWATQLKLLCAFVEILNCFHAMLYFCHPLDFRRLRRYQKCAQHPMLRWGEELHPRDAPSAHTSSGGSCRSQCWHICFSPLVLQDVHTSLMHLNCSLDGARHWCAVVRLIWTVIA